MTLPPVMTIVGAGPAGLVAAITLARGGWRVVVRETRAAVGEQFGSDFPGLENWTDRVDVLEWMQGLGLTTGFRALPCSVGTVFVGWSHAYRMQSSAPLFYPVERERPEDLFGHRGRFMDDQRRQVGAAANPRELILAVPTTDAR